MTLIQLESNKSFGGQQQGFSHHAETLHCDMNFSIYLPPQAESGPVPVIYWLSGLTCTDQNFVQKAGAQQFAAQEGVAIVAPDTSPRGNNVPDDPEGEYDLGLGAGFYVNATKAPWRGHYQMYDYISRELPDLIAAHFPVNGQASIMGHSMGGHGALVMALRNPGRYQSVSAFAPIVAPMSCPWGEKAFSHYLGEDRDSWRQYDSVELIKTAQEKLPILVDQGDADGFLQEQLKPELLEAACKSAEHPLELRMQPGYDHSYFFISTFIGDHIRHHAEALSS